MQARRGSAIASFRLREGWLTKRGHVIRSWKKRLFTLEGATLSYYAAVGDSRPKGTINLIGAAVYPVDAATPRIAGGGWAFTILDRNGRLPSSAVESVYFTSAPTPMPPGAKPFVIEAGSEAERAAWLADIAHNIRLCSGDTSVLMGGNVIPPTAALPGTGVAREPSSVPGQAGSAVSSPSLWGMTVVPATSRAASVALSAPALESGSTPLQVSSPLLVPTALELSSTITPPETPGRRSSSGETARLMTIAAQEVSASSLRDLAADNDGASGSGGVPSRAGSDASTRVPTSEIQLGVDATSSTEYAAAIRVFATTWNMGEGAPANTFCERMLPRGCDVYALAFQECMFTDVILASVRRYLGPGYLEVDHRIGSTVRGLGYHGHIALVIFVADWMVKSGVCKLSRASKAAVPLGVNLGFTRAANKGAVAISLPLRLPDADGTLTVPSALVFISCHLAADLKGADRQADRARDAEHMLNALGLNVPPSAIARAASAAQMAGLRVDSGAYVHPRRYSGMVSGRRSAVSLLTARNSISQLSPEQPPPAHPGRAAGSRAPPDGHNQAVLPSVRPDTHADSPAAPSRSPGNSSSQRPSNASSLDSDALALAPAAGSASSTTQPMDDTQSLNAAEMLFEDVEDEDEELEDAVRMRTKSDDRGGRKDEPTADDQRSKRAFTDADVLLAVRRAVDDDDEDAMLLERDRTSFMSVAGYPQDAASATPIGQAAVVQPAPSETAATGTQDAPGTVVAELPTTAGSFAPASAVDAGVVAGNLLGVSATRSYVFVLGDLNFRVSLAAVTALKSIQTASIGHVNAQAQASAAMEAAANAVKAQSSVPARGATAAVQHGRRQSVGVAGSWDGQRIAADLAERPWRALLRHDQLRAAMAQGAILRGFAEPPITFPPSYRVRRGNDFPALRQRGDFSVLTRVVEMYTTPKAFNAVAAELGVVPGSAPPSASAASDAPPPARTVQTKLGEGALSKDSPMFASDRSVNLPSSAASSREIRTPSYTDRILLRQPLLAGIPISSEDHRRELLRRKSRKSVRLSPSDLASLAGAAHGSNVDDPTSPRSKPRESVLSSMTFEDVGEHAALATSVGLLGARFVPLPQIRCLVYDVCDNVPGSDHLAVSAVWDLPLTANNRAPSDFQHCATRALLPSIAVEPDIETRLPGDLADILRRKRSFSLPATTETEPGSALAWPASRAPFPIIMPSGIEVLTLFGRAEQVKEGALTAAANTGSEMPMSAIAETHPSRPSVTSALRRGSASEEESVLSGSDGEESGSDSSRSATPVTVPAGNGGGPGVAMQRQHQRRAVAAAAGTSTGLSVKFRIAPLLPSDDPLLDCPPPHEIAALVHCTCQGGSPTAATPASFSSDPTAPSMTKVSATLVCLWPHDLCPRPNEDEWRGTLRDAVSMALDALAPDGHASTALAAAFPQNGLTGCTVGGMSRVEESKCGDPLPARRDSTSLALPPALQPSSVADPATADTGFKATDSGDQHSTDDIGVDNVQRVSDSAAAVSASSVRAEAATTSTPHADGGSLARISVRLQPLAAKFERRSTTAASAASAQFGTAAMTAQAEILAGVIGTVEESSAQQDAGDAASKPPARGAPRRTSLVVGPLAQQFDQHRRT